MAWEFAKRSATSQGAKSFFKLLPETPAIFQEWKRLVAVHEVCGLKAGIEAAHRNPSLKCVVRLATALRVPVETHFTPLGLGE